MHGTVSYDLIVVGAGTAGIPAALFAAQRGARVLLVDAADKVGGTLHLSSGQMSAAGTRLQEARGIADTPADHYRDIMRLTENLAEPSIVKRMTELAPAATEWLTDIGFAPASGHPVTGESAYASGYEVARCFWSNERGIAILRVLEKQLAPEVEAGRIVLALGTRVMKILMDNGAVAGVAAQRATGTVEYCAPHVILATGGYAMNPELFQKLTGYRPYVGRAYPFSRGDGLQLAEQAGARLRNHHLHRAGTGSVLTDIAFPAGVYAKFNTYPLDRLPWEIWVNNAGDRFIREDEPSLGTREQALLRQPALRYAVIFDEGILSDAPPGIDGWTREKLREHFGTNKMFVMADTLEDLAQRAGVDPHGLCRTVTHYNAAVASGRDPLGRIHMPRAIAEPPFYAIIQYGHANTSCVGITVDDSLRVLSAAGAPIPGLYAAGEVLGTGVILGRGSIPGPLVAAAIAFGKWLGETLPFGDRRGASAKAKAAC